MAMLNGLIQKLNGEDDQQPKGLTGLGSPAHPNTGIAGGLAPFSAPPPMGGAPRGGGDRLYEMPGTGRSGGVEDAAQMLAGATAQNNRLKDLGNRRSQLDIFDRPGHEGLDREETQIFRDFWGDSVAPRSSYAQPPQTPSGPAMPNSPMADGPAAVPQKSPFKFSQQSVSEILQRYPPTPAGLEQAFRENPQLSESGSRISTLKSGKIFDPTTGRDVDVGLAFGSGGGKGWAWQTGDGAPAARGAGGGGMGLAPLLQADPSTNIQSALSQFGASQDDGFLARLIAQLRGGAL
jgi:hypothetical protein